MAAGMSFRDISSFVGGSMVHPSVPAMLLTPICPHTLSFRQMILPDSVTLRVNVSSNSRSEARVSYDGRHQHILRKGESIFVCFIAALRV